MSYLEKLPYDMIVEILSYVKTSDIIFLYAAFPNFNWLFEDSILMKTINVSREFKLATYNLSDFFTGSIRGDFVKTLNINCIYWIPAQNLRNCLKKMPNLDNLIALDTKLTLCLLDCQVYNNLNLQKLALTVDPVNDFQHSPENYISSIKALVFKYLTTKVLKEEHRYCINRFLLTLRRTLEEIWFINTEECQNLNYVHVAHNLNLKKLVIKSNTSVPLYNFDHLGLVEVFHKRKLDCNELVFQKKLEESQDPNKRVLLLNESNPWNVLMNLHCEMPYGVSEAIKIANKNDNLITMKFNELNFYHTSILCVSKYIIAGILILKSVNARNLKKLSVPSCFFMEELQVKKEPLSSTGFKRTRNGAKILPTNPFEKIAGKLIKLEELEVWFCGSRQGTSEQIFNAYNAISYFTRLKKLTVQVPIVSDGSYLNDVINNCVELESLRVVSIGRNVKLNFNLCKCIKDAKKLKHFRFSTIHMEIDKLFESLNSIENSPLERVFLDFETVDKFSVGPLKVFLENNKQLVFFVILIKTCTKEVMKQVENTLNAAKNKHPAKVFYARRQLSDFPPSFPIPLAHRDLLNCRTEIANINVCEQFK